MKTNMMVIGIALMLTAVATTASAYHMPDPATADHPGWLSMGEVNGQLTLCEFPAAPPEPAQPGVSGLCSMSSTVGQPASTPGSDEWSVVQLQDGSGNGVNAFYRVGTNDHGLQVDASGSFYYRELLAFWSTDGHVTGFADAGGVVEFGSYSGSSAGTFAGIPTACTGADNSAAFGGSPTDATVCTDNLGTAAGATTVAVNLLLCVLDAVDAFLASQDPADLLAALDCL